MSRIGNVSKTVLASLSIMAAPALAETYDFSGQGITFELVTEAPITGAQTYQAADLKSHSGLFSSVTLCAGVKTCGAVYGDSFDSTNFDEIYLQGPTAPTTVPNPSGPGTITVTPTAVTFANDFALGTFATNGVHVAANSGSVLRVNSPAAVPEPATWAMMMVGFGMIGFGLRYRRKSTQVSFA